MWRLNDITFRCRCTLHDCIELFLSPDYRLYRLGHTELEKQQRSSIGKDVEQLEKPMALAMELEPIWEILRIPSSGLEEIAGLNVHRISFKKA